jgi:hypothetical protein
MSYRFGMDLSTLRSEEYMSLPAAVYLPRRPQDSDYYHCVEDYFETFVQGYDEQFSRQYGFWRPYIEQVIYRYLDCGDLHSSFVRPEIMSVLSGNLHSNSNIKIIDK